MVLDCEHPAAAARTTQNAGPLPSSNRFLRLRGDRGPNSNRAMPNYRAKPFTLPVSFLVSTS